MDAPALKKQHFPALDGLRGMAILIVVIYHNFGFIQRYIFFGWVSVDLFFVLSGYLITDILLKTVHKKNYLKNFYARRVLRIFPLYYLSLILFLIVLPRVQSVLDLSYYVKHQAYIWTYLQNWLYVFKDPSPQTGLNHLWSLAVEEQFYILWPFVILILKKPKRLIFFMILLLLCVIGLRLWAWMQQVSQLSYFNLYTFTRIDGICLGCITALVRHINPGLFKKITPYVVSLFALLNFGFYFLDRLHPSQFPYLALIGYTTFALLLALLVNEAVMGASKIVSFIFNISFLRFLGKISYGFYIFHWPLYLMLSPWLYTIVNRYINGQGADLVVSTICSAAGLTAGWLSFHLFEKYFLRMKEKFN